MTPYFTEDIFKIFKHICGMTMVEFQLNYADFCSYGSIDSELQFRYWLDTEQALSHFLD